jgi:hypothetical protein
VGALQSTASAALVVDDFESYAADQVIASSASSTPWLRFGVAIADQLVAVGTPDRVITGTRSGAIPFSWSDGNNASVRRNYGAATDLSAYDAAAIDLRTEEAATSAVVKLAFTDGATTYQSVVGQPLTGAVKNFVFPINGVAVELVDGPFATLADVMKNVRSIGVRFENGVGRGAETVVLDNFTMTSVPEPAGVGLVAVGAGVVAGRRRRRCSVE